MPTSAKTTPRIFGREDLLKRTLEAANTGCSVYALEGVSGVGKSTVLEELTRQVSVALDSIPVTVDAAIHATEDLAIAAIFVQIAAASRERCDLAAHLDSRGNEVLPDGVKRLIVAVLADAAQAVAGKLEHTIETVKDMASGSEPISSLGAKLAELNRDNRRYFMEKYLRLVCGAGCKVFVAIDNLDSAEDGLVSYLRHLIKHKPECVALAIAHNIERGDNLRWDSIVADTRANRGEVDEISPLDAPAVAQWFEAEVGRSPTRLEVENLLEATNGRPHDLKLAFEERDPSTQSAPRRSDYSVFYQLLGRSLSQGARDVVELLSLVQRDAIVPIQHLEIAASVLTDSNLQAILDELGEKRLIRRRHADVGLYHSLIQKHFSALLAPVRRTKLQAAWFATLHGQGLPALATPPFFPMLPAVLDQLIQALAAPDIAQLGDALLTAGQREAGLALLSVWRHHTDADTVDKAFFQHAMLSARSLLDTGHYNQVTDPLQFAAAAADTVEQQAEVQLVRMRLALRKNDYGALESLSPRVDTGASTQLALDGLLIRNTAARDLLDLTSIFDTCAELDAMRESSTLEQRCRIDRALARSLAKLREHHRALKHAHYALEAAHELGTIRAIGNSHLALAEALRFHGSLSDAVSHYRKALDVARTIGNRDSEIWAILGETAVHLTEGPHPAASALIGHLRALLDEPGYVHPLETAHFGLLEALSGFDRASDEVVLRRYAALGVLWPRSYMAQWRTEGRQSEPLPL